MSRLIRSETFDASEIAFICVNRALINFKFFWSRYDLTYNLRFLLATKMVSLDHSKTQDKDCLVKISYGKNYLFRIYRGVLQPKPKVSRHPQKELFPNFPFQCCYRDVNFTFSSFSNL